MGRAILRPARRSVAGTAIAPEGPGLERSNHRNEREHRETARQPKNRNAGCWPALGRAGRAGRASRKTALWIGTGILILIVLVIIASFFIDEPLRRQMERRMNQSLKGYTVQIPKLHFSLFGLSITLHDLTLRQQANPDPPVMVVPKLKASVQWSELVTLHLVADFLFDRPQIHLNLSQLRQENRDPTPMKEKGWQDALEQIYPLKINLFRVNDADVVYIDQDPKHPLHISHLTLRANNIRNIHSREHVYPSPVHAEGVIFESGRGVINGHADFLAKPFPGVHALFRLDKVPLDALKSMVARANLDMKGGRLSTPTAKSSTPRRRRTSVSTTSRSGACTSTTSTPPQRQRRRPRARIKWRPPRRRRRTART